MKKRVFQSLVNAILRAATFAGVGLLFVSAASADFVVYSVYRPLDLGNGEVPQKDYYLNMGSSNGLHEGASLEVIRKVATYDLLSEKLYKDVSFPIARLKVIHVEANAAIARIEKILPSDKTPAVAYRAVMVGDTVQFASAKSE